MALLFMDSFDHYVTADLLEKWPIYYPTSFNTLPTIAATGRHGSNAFHRSSNTQGSQSYGVSLLSSGNTAVVGFAFKSSSAYGTLNVNNIFDPTDYTESNYLLGIRQGGTVQVWLRLDNSGTLSVLRGTTVLATSSLAVPIGAYVYVELKAVIDPSNGSIEVRVNGAAWIPLTTGLNTRNTASSTWNDLLIFGAKSNTATVSITWDYDDFYVLDGSGSAPMNDFLGDIRVDAHYPTANGNSNMSTPSTGTDRYATVDEVAPNDDTDYNTANAIGDKDTFGLQDLIATGSNIRGLQVCMNARKTDAGSVTAAPVIRHGSTDYDGTGQVMGTSYTYLRFLYELNPATGLAFTEADFNAMEIGYKRVG